jgi:hypothetical protein
MAKDNPLYTAGMSRKDYQNIDISAKVAQLKNPIDEARAEGLDTAILDNPEMFATAPGHFDTALVDIPISELEKMYKNSSEGIPVSGDDLAKMGSSNLKPFNNVTTLPGMPTAHVYLTTPSDRAQDPNRRFNLEEPDKGTD